MCQTLLNICLCLYLLVYAVMDIRSMEIWWPLSLVMAALALFFHALSPQLYIIECLWGLLPGALLLVLSKASTEAIGAGDCITIMVCGMSAGLAAVCRIFFLATVMAACWSVLILIRRRSRALKSTFPFIPFLLAARLYLLIA